MTSNDKQIDLLMRRFAKAAPVSVTGHLDADELSAFAEGALPAATRANYVSHLADCDQCRKQASDLTISSGAIVRAEQTHAEISDGRTFWQALAGLFALPVLRYAAFGAVLLIVAGVAFVALRQPRESGLIAQNEPRDARSGSAVKPAAAPQEGISNNKQTNVAPATSSPSQLRDNNDSVTRAGTETSVAESLPVTVPAKEPAAPVIAEKKAGETEVAKAAPSYAPPPPGDTATFSQQKQSASREQQTAGISGPRQQQKLEALDKVAAQDRERDANKDLAKSDDMARKSAPQSSIANNQPLSSRRAGDEKAKGPMRNMDNNTAMNRNENAGRAESPRKRADGEDRASAEEAQTRSAGGRKFRRQGNAWVDQKFKSSMSLKSISRGSSEFAALDGGLRSIAQQLGGEVIVVWKDKAYLIR